MEDLRMDESIILKCMCVDWAVGPFDPNDEGTKIPENVGEYLPDIA